MPYGLFDFEDTIEPMGLSQIVTMAIPENAGIPTTAQKFAYRGAENAPSQQLVTDMAYGENNPPYNVTLAIPEGGVPPTPPSGQCPTGYQSSPQSSPVKPPSSGYQFYAPIGQGRPIPATQIASAR